MNRRELAAELAEIFGSRAAAHDAIDAVFDVIVREVATGGHVIITGVGTFTAPVRESRTGRNPKTGEAVPIPARRRPVFRPAESFRAYVEDPASIPAGRLASVRKPAGQ